MNLINFSALGTKAGLSLSKIARRATVHGAVGAAVILGATLAPAVSQAQAGWYEVGSGWAVLVQPANEARHYGWLLTQPSAAETRIRNLATWLSRYAPNPWGKATAIVAKGSAYIWYPLRYRIDWCASRAPYVYTYHYRSIPVWAYTTW